MDTERLYFIDRLRFLAVMILILFHSALIFAAQSNFPIKNLELSAFIEEVVFFVHNWRLGLLFFISGVGTSIALSFRTNSVYIKERLKRLLIPLLFGILVVVPPQIYLERIAQGFEFDSFWSFYAQSFSTGLYPYGNISWNHLWFVAYLLIYSILSLPLFMLFASHKYFRLDGVMRKGGIVLWAIPIAVVFSWLKPYDSGVQNIIDDLAMFFFYWLIFLAGFVTHAGNYWRIMGHRTFILVGVAILLTGISYWFRWQFPEFEKGDLLYHAFNFIKATHAWFWILVLVSLGKRYLNAPGKYLAMLNQAVYPVYIVHQTVIICIGFLVVRQSWTVGVKYLIIVLTTILICWLLYLILRTNKLTRLLFGMKT